ncbi:hypothetical protein LR48_Vigan97s001300 [Vigna angularis]|uniref:Uncharacterized protein n=1 Tax=Phaseolus angularis TaxID=3914 RepID=A0A0L9T408_PHAAN|nr:hypothetical protein LR48_Vigan97s001300 [Vigna angularis]
MHEERTSERKERTYRFSFNEPNVLLESYVERPSAAPEILIGGVQNPKRNRMADRGTKKQKASSSIGGRRRRRSPTPSPSSSPPMATNDLFSSDEQQEKYAQHFVNREILESKYLEDEYFQGKNFQFYDILHEAGLTEFVCLRRHYHPQLVRVFYSNMSISDTGVIRSEVRGVKIRVSPNLFQQLTNLPSDGVCYEGKVVDEWKEQYDSVTARQLVCRDDAAIQSRILAGHMKVQPRILHLANVQAERSVCLRCRAFG